jgi:hypothetical protein
VEPDPPDLDLHPRHARRRRDGSPPPCRRQAPQDDDLDLLGALVIAGIFTFMPGRIMHHVVFG